MKNLVPITSHFQQAKSQPVTKKAPYLGTQGPDSAFSFATIVAALVYHEATISVAQASLQQCPIPHIQDTNSHEK